MIASDLVQRAAVLLIDQTHVRNSEAQLLDWLNEGRQMIAAQRPDIYTEQQNQTLTSGAYHAAPMNAVRLIDVPANTNGAAISVVPKLWLDQQQPGWTSMTGSNIIKHVCFDELLPTRYWTFPPADGARVIVVYQPMVLDYSLTMDLTPRESVMAPALVSFMCWRAWSQDSVFQDAPARADAHLQLFQALAASNAGVGAATSLNRQRG